MSYQNSYQPYSANTNNFGSNGGGFIPKEEGSLESSKKKLHTYRYVTIKQLKEMNLPSGKDEPIILDNVELNYVILMGTPSTIESGASFKSFKLSDGTGLVDIRVFLSDQGYQGIHIHEQLDAIKEDEYIRVIASVKVFGNSIQLLAICLQPILDGNEITLHFMEALTSHLQLTRPMKKDLQFSNNSMVGNLKSQLGLQSHDRTTLANAMLGFMYNINQSLPNPNVGTHKEKLKQELVQQGFNSVEIDNVFEFLTSEGHIYPGDLDNHICIPKAMI
ncbi:nucleic acid-binding protein [Neoconidiobolus thromboides FSU 785]|nr:nucleic acid-binding protein [Neoconidiobolus thromboides FSU 785]